jgi:glycosyltransferase involved in cell wall biosynthesis
MGEKSDKHRILYIYQEMSPFIRQERRLLEKHYELIDYRYTIKKGAGKELAGWMFINREKYDLIYIWFGDIHTTISVAMAHLLLKKSIVVAGGYDTTYISEINYGLLSNWKRRLYAKFHFSFANAVHSPSEYLRNDASKLSLRNNTHLIYQGIPDYFNPTGEKENLVITQSVVESENFKRKGVHSFIEASRKIPELKFVVIGKIFDKLLLEESLLKSCGNLEFTDYVPFETLLRYMQKAKIYCQLSIHEGFGCALAEAMRCGCVPVTTREGALPEVVGNAGFYVKYGDPEGTVDTIKRAMTEGDGKAAQQRIQDKFPLKSREEALVAIIDGLYLD